MNTNFIEALAEVAPLVESLLAAGTNIISIHVDKFDEPCIHVGAPNGIEIGRLVTQDYKPKSTHDHFSVHVGSIQVCWLTEKVKVAA